MTGKTEHEHASQNKTRRPLRRLGLAKLGILGLCIPLFALALLVLKEGARPLSPIVRGSLSVDNPGGALGLGWLSAMLVLSGSPVAATALTFQDAGVLSRVETYLMIAGSRLGAAFIVLLIGFLYLLRGVRREASLGAGLLSLLVTQTIYAPSIALGLVILANRWMERWSPTSDSMIDSPVDRMFAPLILLLKANLSPWMLFPIGLLLMLASFSLFDRALPNLRLESTQLGRVNRLLYRPIVTFLLGLAVTSLTLSVSLSLSLLVPLSARGFVRQENAIPYIMGANITTFLDTLAAAALLANPEAVAVVS